MIGKIIKHYRLKRQLNQTQLANLCGFNQSYIGHIEKGYANPTLNALNSICQSLEIPIEIAFFLSYDLEGKDKALSHIKGLVTDLYTKETLEL
jgi:transcriptional regulator with XRE-family HTH domain